MLPHHTAPVADEQSFSLFYPEKGYEEEGKVVIHPPKLGPCKSADRAKPAGVFKLHCLGLYATYEEEEHVPPSNSYNIASLMVAIKFTKNIATIWIGPKGDPILLGLDPILVAPRRSPLIRRGPFCYPKEKRI